MTDLSFSVVIPARNEERFIPRTLEALRRLTYPPERFEVIVADNGSTDRTPDLARSFGARVVTCSGLGVGAARNRGAREAKGKFLAFLDADCVPEPDWLARAEASLTSERSITGSEVGLPPNATWIERAWFLQTSLVRSDVTHINTGNMIILKDLFLEIGGFDETLISGEDYEFCTRSRTQYNIPSIADGSIRVTHFGNPTSLLRVFHREVWHGLGAFGSLKFQWLDKSLAATLLFLFSSLAQCIGLAAILHGGLSILGLGTAGVVLAVAASVWNRRSAVRGVLHALQLAVLYYVYYLGRSVALVYLALGKRSYLRRR